MNLQAKAIYHLVPAVETPEITQGLETIQRSWLEHHSRDSEVILYHYTTLEGLREILSNRAIWFSHITSLNDPLEFQYGKSLVTEELDSALENQHETEIKKYLNQLKQLVFQFEHIFHAYVACFCESDNLLSQWRGYGASDGGYNLGISFETETKFSHNYENLEEESHVILRKIIYDKDKQKVLVNEIVEELVASASKGLVAIQSRGDLPPGWASIAAMQAVNILCDIILSLKNPAFQEETEWRLVKTMQSDKNPQLVNFRERNNMLIPYLNTYIFTRDKQDLKFPLRTIRFGPMLDTIRTKPSLELFVYNVASMTNKIEIKPNVLIKAPDYSLRHT